MKIYVTDPKAVELLKENGGNILKEFCDVNGVAVYEFSYDGNAIDINALVSNNQAIVCDQPNRQYL